MKLLEFSLLQKKKKRMRHYRPENSQKHLLFFIFTAFSPFQKRFSFPFPPLFLARSVRGPLPEKIPFGFSFSRNRKLGTTGLSLSLTLHGFGNLLYRPLHRLALSSINITSLGKPSGAKTIQTRFSPKITLHSLDSSAARIRTLGRPVVPWANSDPSSSDRSGVLSPRAIDLARLTDVFDLPQILISSLPAGQKKKFFFAFT